MLGRSKTLLTLAWLVLVGCGGSDTETTDAVEDRTEQEAEGSLAAVREARMRRAGCSLTQTHPDEVWHLDYDPHGWEIRVQYGDNDDAYAVESTWEREDGRVVSGSGLSSTGTVFTYAFDEHEHQVHHLAVDREGERTAVPLTIIHDGELKSGMERPFVGDARATYVFDSCENQVRFSVDGEVISQAVWTYVDMESCLPERALTTASDLDTRELFFDADGRPSREVITEAGVTSEVTFAWDCP